MSQYQGLSACQPVPRSRPSASLWLHDGRPGKREPPRPAVNVTRPATATLTLEGWGPRAGHPGFMRRYPDLAVTVAFRIVEQPTAITGVYRGRQVV